VKALHDYVRGAFEALSWVRKLLVDLRRNPEGLERAVREVDEAIEDIREGVAIDFRERLRGG